MAPTRKQNNENNMLKTVLKTVLDGLIVINQKGEIQSFNHSAEKIFGYEAKEVIGKNIGTLMPSPHRDAHDNYLDHYLKTGERKIIGIGREVVAQHKDGSLIPIDLGVNEVRIEGKLLFVGTIRDISQRKKYEAEITSMGRIVEDSLNEVFIFDAKTLRFLNVNRGARENMGYTMEELAELTPIDIKPDLTEADFHELIEPLKDGSEPKLLFETRHQRKDGSFYNVEVHLQLTEYRGVPAYVAIILDITGRKLAEEKQEKLMEKLVQSNTELERFAYVASHDMQEPLRMIVSFSEIIKNKYMRSFDADCADYFSRVVESGQRMQELVNDLLEYSRVNDSSQKTQLVCGNDELKRVLDNLNIIMDESHATVTYDSLPSFRYNSVRFMRLLQNLITNAIKYQPKGNAPVIHIGSNEQDGNWVIYVKDNGIGVDQQFIKQIFQPFRRLHTWDNIQGTGLGLAICKKIVESHGGKIWVESVPGEGSIFYLGLK